MLFSTILSDVGFSVLTGVGIGMCCMDSNIARKGRQNCELAKIPVVSVSAAEEKTYLSVLKSTWMIYEWVSLGFIVEKSCNMTSSFGENKIRRVRIYV